MALAMHRTSGSRSKCSQAKSFPVGQTRGDFVGDEEGAVAGAERADAANELVLGDEGAEVADDRLHDEGGNVALLQQLLDLAKSLVIQRRLDLVAVGQEVLERLAVVRRADAHGGDRVAVVAVLDGHERAAAGVGHGDLQRAFDRFRAAGVR
jgi:hypothetical protein